MKCEEQWGKQPSICASVKREVLVLPGSNKVDLVPHYCICRPTFSGITLHSTTDVTKPTTWSKHACWEHVIATNTYN